jgi:Flp pilus assembly protein TadB
MSIGFLFAGSLLMGYGLGLFFQWFWERMEKHRQAQRLQTALSQRKKALPLQSLLALLEDQLSLISNSFPAAKSYDAWLQSLLRRSGKVEFQPHQMFGYQLLAGLGLGLLLFLFLGEATFSFLGLALGAALPVIWLRDRALRRERLLLRELPNALEVVSLCCEAGLTVEQGMDQYLKNARPNPLASEFSAMLEQTRSGASRKAALESAATKIQLTDFSLFTTSLIHAERFGTGVAQTLRQLSTTLRDKQTQAAEKAVQELPVKLILPLVFFIMPVTFLIIFGPVLLQFLHP